MPGQWAGCARLFGLVLHSSLCCADCRQLKKRLFPAWSCEETGRYADGVRSCMIGHCSCVYPYYVPIRFNLCSVQRRGAHTAQLPLRLWRRVHSAAPVDLVKRPAVAPAPMRMRVHSCVGTGICGGLSRACASGSWRSSRDGYALCRVNYGSC